MASRLLAGISLAILLCACTSPTPSTSSETHFVACETDLECVAKLGTGSVCRNKHCESASSSLADANGGTRGSVPDANTPDGATHRSEAGGTGGQPREAGSPARIPPCSTQGAYSADGQCLDAPPAADGFQLHIGPTDYNDPNTVTPYMVSTGDETTYCVFIETPNVEEKYVDRYEVHHRPDAISVGVFFAPAGAAATTGSGPDACTFGNPMLLATIGSLASGRFAGAAPEFAGAALPLPTHTGVEIDVHMANLSDLPILGEAWINVYYAAPSAVTTLLHPIALTAGLAMNVPTGQTQVISSAGTACVADSARELFLLGTAPRRSVNLTRVFVQPSGSADRTNLYEGYTSDELNYLLFDSVTTNQPWAPAVNVGGVSGRVSLAAGDALSWECDVQNFGSGALRYSDTAVLGGGCHVFGFYVAPIGTPWTCTAP